MEIKIRVSSIKVSEIADDVKKALTEGLNRAASGLRESIAKDVFAKYAIKKMDIKKQITVSKANKNRLQAILNVKNWTRFGRIPLSWFSFSQKKAGVVVEVFRGKKQLIKSSFWSRFMRAASTIARRIDKPRLPVKELTAADLGVMVLSVFKLAQIDRVVELFNRNFKSYLKFLRAK